MLTHASPLVGHTSVAILLLLAFCGNAGAFDVDPPYEHPEVYAWYHGTIDTNATSVGQNPPVIIDDTGLWYENREEQGHYYSRIGGGSGSRPADGGFRVTPSYAPEQIYNGDFEVGVSATDHLCWAGWHYHGGGGARTWQYEDGNHFARLNAADRDTLTHNRMYVPPDAVDLWVRLRVNGGYADLWIVLIDEDGNQNWVWGGIPLGGPAVWADLWFDIHPVSRGKTRSLCFRTEPIAPATTIDLDDIRFGLSGGGLDQDDIQFTTSPTRGSVPPRRSTDSLYRTTLITHGYTIMGPTGQTTVYADWMVPMAEAIRDRAGQGTVLQYDPETGGWNAIGGIATGEIVLVSDWMQESDLPNLGGTKGFAEGAADALYTALRDPQLPGALEGTDLLANDLHFIGHSRGSVVNSEIIERIAQAGFDVDHVTTLDPHPANGSLPPIWFDFGDPEPETWQGVTWAENYWRADGTNIDFNGKSIPGAYNVDLGPAIEVYPPDWGDAPDAEPVQGYPTLAIHNGASHFTQGPWLGGVVDDPDFELDGQPDPNALGDDSAGYDDEDGVTIPVLTQGQPGTIVLEVNGGGTGGGVVEGWIDWDANQVWAHPGEQVIASYLATGMHALNVAVPSNSVYGQTYARFRISTSGGLTPVGQAENGEVEDYFVEIMESSGVPEDPTPQSFRLFQSVPNPFNPMTVIRYDLPSSEVVTLRVFDASGRTVRVLRDSVHELPGEREVVWDGRDDSGRQVASGTYFYRLVAGDFSATRTMVLVR